MNENVILFPARPERHRQDDDEIEAAMRRHPASGRRLGAEVVDLSPLRDKRDYRAIGRKVLANILDLDSDRTSEEDFDVQ